MIDGDKASIEEAKKELVAQLFGLEGLTMIGIGERGGKPCLTVHFVSLRDADLSRIPTEHRGWPVDARESGPIRALEE